MLFIVCVHIREELNLIGPLSRTTFRTQDINKRFNNYHRMRQLIIINRSVKSPPSQNKTKYNTCLYVIKIVYIANHHNTCSMARYSSKGS